MRIGEARNTDDLIEALEQARKRRQEMRRGIEARWWDNMALVAGDHNARWDPVLSRYENRDPTWLDDLSDKKAKMVVNHVLTVTRTELAKLLKSRPIMEVIANSDEETDLAATKVAKSALDFVEWKFKLPKLRKNAWWVMLQTGLAAIYVGWDYLNDNAGEFTYLIDPATGEPTFNPTRMRELRDAADRGELRSEDLAEQKLPLGELEYKMYYPHQLFPDENALDFEEIKELITTEVHDVDVIRGVYDTRVEPERVQLGVMESRIMRLNGLETQTATNSSSACYVHSWWLPPNVYRGNKFLEKGKFIRWTNDRKVLDNSDAFPFSDGRIPFTFFQHIPSSTSIWPDCVVSHLAELNLEIDKTISQLVENKDYMANPMWLIATQHRIKNEIRNVAGGIVKYVHSPNVPPPTPVPGMEMPKQVEDLAGLLREMILEISGQSEVARGRVPTGVRSGVAVAYMQEEDDTKISPTVEGIEEATAMLASMTLSRIAQFYSLERTIRFYRRDGGFDVLKFKGADLKNNTDVVAQAGSAMPKSKAARQQYTLELVQLGILRDPHKIFEMLELGQGEPDNSDKARAQADRENNMMRFGILQGQLKVSEHELDDMQEEQAVQRLAAAVPVKKWHLHEVHLDRHRSVMMEPEFDQLSITHPWVVRLFDEHIAMHEQALQEQQQQQLQMLMAAKGAPGEMGGTPAGDQAQPGQTGGNVQTPDDLNVQLTTRSTLGPGG